MVSSCSIAYVAAARALLATVASVVIGVVIAMAITHGLRWKVSLHLGGIAGSVTVFVLLFGPDLLLLTPLVALVGWAAGAAPARTTKICQPPRSASSS
jgi:hypothetical protein